MQSSNSNRGDGLKVDRQKKVYSLSPHLKRNSNNHSNRKPTSATNLKNPPKPNGKVVSSSEFPSMQKKEPTTIINQHK